MWVPACVVFVALFLSNRRLLNEIFVYQKLFCFLTPVGSSSYHDHVDGNEKIKGSLRNSDSDGNANARISKTTTSHVNHAFCTFLYRHCTTTRLYDEKVQQIFDIFLCLSVVQLTRMTL